MKKRTVNQPNAIAKDLRTPKYRKRIVKCKKTYDRKKVCTNLNQK